MTAMQTRRWFNQAQPQTLQIATFLLYAGGAFMLLFLALDRATSVHAGLYYLVDDVGLSRLGMLVLAGAHIAAGYGLANERKWSYPVALACAGISIALNLYSSTQPGEKVDLFGLITDIALLALLLHNQSRDYQRIWFK